MNVEVARIFERSGLALLAGILEGGETPAKNVRRGSGPRGRWIRVTMNGIAAADQPADTWFRDEGDRHDAFLFDPCT